MVSSSVKGLINMVAQENRTRSAANCKQEDQRVGRLLVSGWDRFFGNDMDVEVASQSDS